MRSNYRLIATTLALIMTALLLGCGDDEVTNPRRPEPLPVTADSLMALFGQAYGDMNLSAYEKLLHADYRFVFSQSDVEDLALQFDFLDRQDEVAIAGNMFSGVVGPTGAPPIANIWLSMTPATPWQDSSNHPRFPNTSQRVYNIMISIERPGSTTLEVSGTQQFFATSSDSTLSGGDTVQVWRLVGQIDTSWAAKGESSGWGRIKYLYWDRQF